MSTEALTALSPLDGRYAEAASGLRALFSEFALIRYRIEIEIRWLIHLSREPAVAELSPFSENTLEFLRALFEKFGVENARRVKELERTTNHDVKAMEYYLRERFGAVEELQAAVPFLHFACTSEDVNNLSYALALRDARRNVLSPTLDELIDALAGMARSFAQDTMLARTHGQPASPTTMGKEFANWVHRLRRQFELLKGIPLLGKINGAVGNYNAHFVAYPEVDWPAVARTFVESLQLNWNSHTTQIEPHDFIAEYCHALIRINTVLLDLARDVWGYVSLGYFTQKRAPGEVGSSTMPHKVNPVDFENAEGNLGIANALLQHLAVKLPVSRWQRDLSDSTALRNLGVALAHSLIAWQSCLKGLRKLEIERGALARDLNGCWEILAEAIQTVMRKNGIVDSYEQLKALTHGERIDAERLRAFIADLAIDGDDKRRLLLLTPAAYAGNAEVQARSV
jgi:adenylosuccinate lyase